MNEDQADEMLTLLRQIRDAVDVANDNVERIFESMPASSVFDLDDVLTELRGIRSEINS